MQQNLVDKLKEWIVKIVTSRLFVVWVVILCLFTFVLQHLFTLQIIKGSDYLDNYMMKIEKTIDIEGTRGNIYDRNGVIQTVFFLSAGTGSGPFIPSFSRLDPGRLRSWGLSGPRLGGFRYAASHGYFLSSFYLIGGLRLSAPYRLQLRPAFPVL